MKVPSRLEAAFDRVDAIRVLRNQKYSGLERTEKDVAAANAVFDEIEQLAEQWLKANLTGPSAAPIAPASRPARP
ncbi:MAG TPA: hypothetical protein VLJ58_05325 [Ramlibacter sp.]|nr:hypothetical protein [Ramlibacter sp.]